MLEQLVHAVLSVQSTLGLAVILFSRYPFSDWINQIRLLQRLVITLYQPTLWGMQASSDFADAMAVIINLHIDLFR